MSKYSIDKEFAKYVHLRSFVSKPVLKVMSPMAKLLRPKSDSQVEVRIRRVPGYNNHEIDVLIFEPKNLEDNAPCLVYFHGGAFAMPAGPHHYTLAKEYAVKAECKVLFVDYRLSVIASFPVPVEDCFFAYKWTVENADELNINQEKIAIGGDSAGGNLAACVALMARDRMEIQPCFQMLIYPVIDRRMQTTSMKNFTDTPIWDSRLSKKMWKIYLQDDAIEEIGYASPIEAKSLENLPSAYVETAEFDCLHDEGIEYAKALQEAGSQVEIYQTKGTIHGFDIELKSNIVKNSIKRRVSALSSAFKDRE